MVRRSAWLALLACAVAVSCGRDEYEWVYEDVPPDPIAPDGDASVQKKDGGLRRDGAPNGTAPLRIVAANISSGDSQKYEAEGIRILKALEPDVTLLQE